MGINRKVVEKPKKRDRAELIEKHQKIGELLKLDPVPTHTLAWKEDRLDLDSGDCYPVIDVLGKISELLEAILRGHPVLKSPGRPKKVK